MEVDDIQGQGCKFQRIGNGGRSSYNKTGNKGGGVNPDDEEDGEVKRVGGGGLTGGSLVAGGGRLCGWPASRIVRVSRASGGKDRHSKVLTSRGLRDRRVRLSVGTAIQFYDLQDRLGYDQPSKAVEWLLKAAAKSIDELPSITTPFPETTNLLSDEKRSSPPATEQRFDSAELELDGDDLNFHHHHNHHHHASLSKSANSSTSETSKGSGLSLSRCESRIKARERAKERMAEKEKEKDGESRCMNPNSQSSFTELLTSGINVNRETNSQNGSAQRNVGGGVAGEANLFPKPRQWSSAAMDYFSPPSPSRNHNSSGFSGIGNSLPMAISPFNVAGDHHPELQFSFVQDHLMPVASSATGGNNDYNLNFTISSGFAGMNRGTLQSNAPSLMSPHIQRLSSIDGSNAPFFIGNASPNAAPVENHHHQFPSGLDGRLQLYGGRHSDQRGKGKH